LKKIPFARQHPLLFEESQGDVHAKSGKATIRLKRDLLFHFTEVVSFEVVFQNCAAKENHVSVGGFSRASKYALSSWALLK
jgi:hypothetical protein